MAESRHSRLDFGVKVRFTKVKFGPRKPILPLCSGVNLAVAPSEQAISPSESIDKKQESDDFFTNLHNGLFMCIESRGRSGLADFRE